MPTPQDWVIYLLEVSKTINNNPKFKIVSAASRREESFSRGLNPYLKLDLHIDVQS
ncbi:hypothetical protein [Nostoc sp.]|uniref:hypothetical protein n=1 Tax=Nostoc sp. TaxID=1180 RepID=UPI002FFA6A6C